MLVRGLIPEFFGLYGRSEEVDDTHQQVQKPREDIYGILEYQVEEVHHAQEEQDSADNQCDDVDAAAEDGAPGELVELLFVLDDVGEVVAVENVLHDVLELVF